MAQLGALPESADLGAGTRAWHASPKTDLASFWPEPGDDELELLEGVADRRLVFGHFHVSFDRIGAHGIELVAPGAVGIPLDGDHRAAWALMHDDGRIERRRVAYDHAASAARVREVADGAPWGDVVAGRIERAGLDSRARSAPSGYSVTRSIRIEMRTQRAPLVEVLAAQARRHDVDRLDVAQRHARLVERRLHRIVRALARAADQLDDLGDRHRASFRFGDRDAATLSGPAQAGW